MENRTVLFLYPELYSVDSVERQAIIRNITDLKLVITEANNQIKKILQQEENFSYIRCLPNIEMEEANKHPCEENMHFVRVCVIGHDSKNYSQSYSDICNKYVNNTLDISHLIGLKINSNLEKIKFSKPDDSPFDVIVESNMKDLISLLISIMLDTSLYHYFSLNNDIRYRKNFSEIKMRCIKEKLTSNEYGQVENLESIKYLPFSYPYIKRYSLSKENRESTTPQTIIYELIKKYFDFIKNYVCFPLEYNKKRESQNPYAKINPNLKNALGKIVKKANIDINQQYIIAIKTNVLKDREPVEETDYYCLIVDDEVSKKWLSLFANPLNEFSLFYLKIGV